MGHDTMGQKQDDRLRNFAVISIGKFFSVVKLSRCHGWPGSHLRENLLLCVGSLTAGKFLKATTP
jgi:hypothetical protein